MPGAKKRSKVASFSGSKNDSRVVRHLDSSDDDSDNGEDKAVYNA